MDQAKFLGTKAVQSSLKDREAVVARWLTERLNADDPVEVLEISTPPESSGFSSELFYLGEMEKRRAIARC